MKCCVALAAGMALSGLALAAEAGASGVPRLAQAGSGASGEWPCWRGANRDGRSPDTGLLKEWPAAGPKLRWKVNDIGAGFSSVAVSRGAVFVTGNVGDKMMLSAFDMDGKNKWRTPVCPAWTGPYSGTRSTPTVDNGLVYLLTEAGNVGCYDAGTGQLKWGRSLKEFGGRPGNWGYAESVLVSGNLAVVTPGGRNCIVALDKATGRPIWHSVGFEAPAHYSSCIAVTHGYVPMIINGTGGGIFAVNPANGTLLWSNNFSSPNTANCPTPVYADGYVFWANGYGKGGICLKLSAAGGKLTAMQAWTTRDMDCHHGGYIIDKGYVYGNNGNGWVCLDLKTGQKKWSAPSVGKGSLCYADGMLYLFGERGGQVALATCSPDGVQIKGNFKVAGQGESWAHPVVIGGRLYIRYGTNLYCFDVKGN